MKLNDAVREFQHGFIKYGLTINHGNIRATARMLGKHPATMQRWVQTLSLDMYARDLRRSLLRARYLRMAYYLTLTFTLLSSLTLKP